MFMDFTLSGQKWTRPNGWQSVGALARDMEENRTFCVGQELLLDARAEDGTANYS